ncbi:MAG: hypothetical protein HHAS10_04290 [Candidatus Altimarinota bacterium]
MKTFFIALLGAIFGAAGFIIYNNSTHNPFLDYYTTENAVAVSPHDLRMEMDKGLNNTIIVDLRTHEEYKMEHIRGAINIPGVENSDKDSKMQRERIISEFKKLPKDKRIIIHCYTHYCMLAKHVGLMLAEEGIQVHELNIGWNEWRNEWDLWNGEGTSKNIDISTYLEGSNVQYIKQNQSGSIDIKPCTKDGLTGC